MRDCEAYILRPQNCLAKFSTNKNKDLPPFYMYFKGISVGDGSTSINLRVRGKVPRKCKSQSKGLRRS